MICLIRSRPISRRQTRRGFSLIELLMVVSLIVVLVGISLPLVGRMSTNAKIAATRATIAKINGLIAERRQAFGRLQFSDTEIKLGTAALNPGGGVAPMSLTAREVLYRKSVYRLAFPQVYDETNPNVIQRPSTINPLTESAELLYIILTDGAVFGVPPVGDDFFSSSEVKDTDIPPNGRKELVDAWGKPLRFYRWPTRVVRPDGYGTSGTYTVLDLQAPNYDLAGLLMPGVNAALLIQDPDDPLGAFADEVQRLYPTQNPETSDYSKVTVKMHTLVTFHTPLLMSAGPDGYFGLYPPQTTAKFGHLAAPMSDVSTTDPDYVNFDTTDTTNYNVLTSTLNDNITNFQRGGAN